MKYKSHPEPHEQSAISLFDHLSQAWVYILSRTNE